MDITFCNEKCLTGKAARDKFLAKNNSAFDAVVDFTNFRSVCSKTCPYREIRQATSINKEIVESVKQ